MSGVMLFLATLILLLLIFSGLAFLRRPVYRLSRDNVISLIELVLDDKASEEDWTVFVEMPIRYDVNLESIRQKCLLLAGEDTKGAWNSTLRSKDGQAQLRTMLRELKDQREA